MNASRVWERLRLASLALLALVWLTPLLFVAMTAIRSQGDLISSGVFSWTSHIQWNNFANAWHVGRFSGLFQNSVLLILIKVPLGILLSSLAAYALATMNFPLKWLVLPVLLLGLAIPVHVILLPLALLLKTLRINNNLFSLIPAYIALGLPFQTLVLVGFFRTIPVELFQAADLDGCSELQKYWRLAMPLSRPAWITLAIIDLVGTWNDLLLPLVLIGQEKWQTVPLGLLQFQGEFASRYTMVMAAILIAIAPVLIIYILCQRFLSTEMTAGALKE